MFAATKLRRGMILTRIRGEIVKPWAMGENTMCHHPVWFSHISLSYPTTILMLCRVVEAVILLGSGVWQDCQSFPTCTLHQQVDPHIGKENHHRHHSMQTLHSLHDGAVNTPTLPTRHSPLSLILTQGRMSCVSNRGCFPVLVSRSQDKESFPLSFAFSAERNLVCFHPYIGI